MILRNGFLLVFGMLIIGCTSEEVVEKVPVTNNDFELTNVDELTNQIAKLERRLFSDANFTIEMDGYNTDVEINEWANYFADSSLVKVQSCNFEDATPWRYEFYFDDINNPIAIIFEGIEGDACWFNNEVIYRQTIYFEKGEIVDNVIDMPSNLGYSFTKEDATKILSELQLKLG